MVVTVSKRQWLECGRRVSYAHPRASMGLAQGLCPVPFLETHIPSLLWLCSPLGSQVRWTESESIAWACLRQLGGGTQQGTRMPLAEAFLPGRLGLITGEGIGP